ncbi:MAG: YfiR family protein [Cyclobacteriaceae bacterium]
MANYSTHITSYSTGLRRMLLLSFLFLSIVPLKLNAQKIDAKYQSVFIFGVSRQIQWSDADGTFDIAVIGENKNLVKELIKLSGSKKINDKKVVIKEFTNSSSLSSNHEIVFVSSKKLLASVLKDKGNNTLVLTAFDGAIGLGSHLNFYLDGNKVAFDLNKREITSSTNLKVNESLVKLASKTI